MPSPVITPQMNLIQPLVGGTLSPTWALELNQNFLTIDQHDHTPGKGAPIVSNSLNINTDLPFLDNNATDLRSVRFTPQLSPLNLGTDIGCIYVSGVDLYYNDVNGNQIRLTASGSIVGSPGSIAGLVSPASATYISLSQTFVWQANSGIAANMDNGTIILRYPGSYPTPSGIYIALQVPSSLSSAYALTLPTGLPVSGTSFLMVNSAGQMSDDVQVDETTLTSSGSILRIKDLGVSTAKIANSAVTTPKIADGAITSAKLAASNLASSPSCDHTLLTSGGSTNLFVLTLTASGSRPVKIEITPDGNLSGNLSRIILANASTPAVSVQFDLYRDFGTGSQTLIGSSLVSTNVVYSASFGSVSQSLPFVLNVIDSPTNGSHTYTLRASVPIGTGQQISLDYSRMQAYSI